MKHQHWCSDLMHHYLFAALTNHSEWCMLLNPSSPAPCTLINALATIPVDIKFQTELEATLQVTSNPEWCVSKCIQRKNHWGVTMGRQCVFKFYYCAIQSLKFVCIYCHAGSRVWFCKALPHCIVTSTAYTCNNHTENLYFSTPTLHNIIWAYSPPFSVTICNDVWIYLNVGKLTM